MALEVRSSEGSHGVSPDRRCPFSSSSNLVLFTTFSFLRHVFSYWSLVDFIYNLRDWDDGKRSSGFLVFEELVGPSK
jgi:hypothetical protein